MDILLVEDNLVITEGLIYAFKKENYQIISFTNIHDTINYLNNSQVKLIILDVSLPDGNGFDLYKNIIKDKKIPTIFLTAMDDEENVIKGLSLGVDDYIKKPFSTRELLIRVNNIMLRNNIRTMIKVKDISFDMNKLIVKKDNKIIDLTSLELKILHLLFLNINSVVRRNTILESIWEWTGNDVDDHTLTVYLKRIREKLGTDIIVTVKGIGYRIDEE